MSSPTILIADDDPAIRKLVSLLLTDEGYNVLTAVNGFELVRMAQEQQPDLLIIDLMMPELDGYEAVRQLRRDSRTAHMPMLILTARATPGDVVVGFETGADDYVSKPFHHEELLARIRRLLQRATQRPVRSPLTGLAGNVLLTEEIGYRLRRGDNFALIYVDINNFKVFNDTYGFARGDQVIRLLAMILTEQVAAAGGERDFIGHIGGDDFAVITGLVRLRPICAGALAAFNQRVRDLYEPEDLARGYLEGHDRHGVARQFPIITISIGGVTSNAGSYNSADEVGRAAAMMKQQAKSVPDPACVIDGQPGL